MRIGQIFGEVSAVAQSEGSSEGPLEARIRVWAAHESPMSYVCKPFATRVGQAEGPLNAACAIQLRSLAGYMPHGNVRKMQGYIASSAQS